MSRESSRKRTSGDAFSQLHRLVDVRILVKMCVRGKIQFRFETTKRVLKKMSFSRSRAVVMEFKNDTFKTVFITWRAMNQATLSVYWSLVAAKGFWRKLWAILVSNQNMSHMQGLMLSLDKEKAASFLSTFKLNDVSDKYKTTIGLVLACCWTEKTIGMRASSKLFRCPLKLNRSFKRFLSLMGAICLDGHTDTHEPTFVGSFQSVYDTTAAQYYWSFPLTHSLIRRYKKAQTWSWSRGVGGSQNCLVIRSTCSS